VQGAPDDATDAAIDGLPRRFGKYTLLRKLATGGMAEIFLAIQKSPFGFEKLVVVKRILPERASDRAFVEMFLHEARVAATLSHPNVVQTFDVGEIDGAYFIAMEHVHGEDLRSIVRHMKKQGVAEFPLEHAISIVLGTCAGLAYAHERRDLDGAPMNLVHRDVSPQNVVVTFGGDVKLVDFGIAKSDARVEEDTTHGHLRGKVPYMSPEQARGEPLDARSDVFAVGVLLFELTTGKRLFKSRSEYDTLRLICEEDYPRPRDVCPGYSVELEAIVVKALAKDRDARWQSARELQGALEELVRHERLAVSPIALGAFMRTLFADELGRHREALAQGRRLPEAMPIDVRGESMVTDDSRSRWSTPAVASTRRPPPSKTEWPRGGWIAAGTAALLVAAVGSVWVSRRFAPAAARSAPALEVEGALATGRLDVAVGSGACHVTVDGISRGSAPVRGVELSPGPHVVACAGSDGRVLREQVTVVAGQTAHAAFAGTQ
jgi:serine/threonine-protein kinase